MRLICLYVFRHCFEFSFDVFVQTFVKNNGDKVLNELLAHALRNDPARFVTYYDHLLELPAVL